MTIPPSTIRFESVTKSFPLQRGQVLLRDRVAWWLRGNRRERFQALSKVSFHVTRGESVAIIGPNGAGKSTLLALAAGLTKPDEGMVDVQGQIAALLELGAGFHPDLTGAENLRISASVLGMSRQTVVQRFDRIVEFAGVRDFIHQPMRTYSAGMIMRLGFAVAISVDPDVLVIDEVLGVGDQAFFSKCLRKILEFREAGKTILCASHSTSLVKMLCDRALWLDHGRLISDGPTEEVVAAYQGSATGTG